MFHLEKWRDDEYEKKLQELVIKDEELVNDVIRKIVLERLGMKTGNYCIGYFLGMFSES